MTTQDQDTHFDLEVQMQIEATPGAPRWQRKNVRRF